MEPPVCTLYDRGARGLFHANPQHELAIVSFVVVSWKCNAQHKASCFDDIRRRNHRTVVLIACTHIVFYSSTILHVDYINCVWKHIAKYIIIYKIAAHNNICLYFHVKIIPHKVNLFKCKIVWPNPKN